MCLFKVEIHMILAIRSIFFYEVVKLEKFQPQIIFNDDGKVEEPNDRCDHICLR